MTRDEIFNNNVHSSAKPSQVTAADGSKFIGATFLYLALALLVTFGVVGGMGAAFSFALDGSEAGGDIFVYAILAALILYFPVLIWVRIAAIRNGKTVGPAFFTYSIVMGALLSPLCIVAGYVTVILAIGTTCLSFAVMALIAWTSKKNLSNFAVIGLGLLLGAMLIGLANLIIYFIVGFEPLYWLVSFLFFIAIILITVADLNNVKQLAMNGETGKNIALMCALNLYVDFVYIFIRILRLLAIMRNK